MCYYPHAAGSGPRARTCYSDSDTNINSLEIEVQMVSCHKSHFSFKKKYKILNVQHEFKKETSGYAISFLKGLLNSKNILCLSYFLWYKRPQCLFLIKLFLYVLYHIICNIYSSLAPFVLQNPNETLRAAVLEDSLPSPSWGHRSPSLITALCDNRYPMSLFSLSPKQVQQQVLFHLTNLASLISLDHHSYSNTTLVALFKSSKELANVSQHRRERCGSNISSVKNKQKSLQHVDKRPCLLTRRERHPFVFIFALQFTFNDLQFKISYSLCKYMLHL